ncbi:MAG: hypothetical protein AzoDbin1_02112 [Azoarcus sp.]|nr:hypothetical protein [Azoarcus sp.]
MPNGYNHIFDQLVGDDQDFVGIVAYTVYKRQKIEWLKQFEAANGRPANDAEIKGGFAAFSILPSQVNSYRDKAITLIDNFVDAALNEAIEEIREEMLTNAVVNAVKKSFWASIWENLVAGAFASLLTLGAAGLVWIAAKGPENLWREALQHYFQQQPVQQTPQQTIK